MADFKRIKFKVSDTEIYDLGYHEIMSMDYEGNVKTRIVPRAKGIHIWNTDELGGGELRITVRVFVAKNSRLELELFMINLINNLANKKGTLIIENTLTLTDCHIQRISFPNEFSKTAVYTINLVKSL